MNYCLRRFFEAENLEDKRDYVICDKCKTTHPKGCPAVKQFFLRNPPRVLIVLLKRFKSYGHSLMKNNEDVDTLEKLYLDDYVIIDGIKL